MKLALLALASFALALVPAAAADTVVCQPAAIETACLYVWTGTYSNTGAQVCAIGPAYVCVAGLHVEYPGYTANLVGGVVCAIAPAPVGLYCASATVGQWDRDTRFMVGTEGGFFTPAATHWQQIFVGTDNNAPYRYVGFCSWIAVTGGTCLVL